MLTLTRKLGESVSVGDARIEIAEIRKGRVRMRFWAPATVPILRGELASQGRESPQSRAALVRVLRVVMAWCAANDVEFGDIQKEAQYESAQ